MRLAAAAATLGVAAGTTYFKESFAPGWEKTWTPAVPEGKEASQMGDFKWTGGKYPGAAGDKGIQTSEDARFYSISAPLSKPVDNKGKDLVLSYTVKLENEVDCGGAYIKLLPGGYDVKKFGGDTPYSIMFGPDICGYSTRKTHAILTYKGKNLLTKKNIRAETDRMSHRYTFVIRHDNTYEVQIDGSKVESGNLADDWDFLAPKLIKDPSAKKPSTWVDEATIPDPEDVKPAGWDDIPAKIPDPAATKPEDWDEEDDGKWEAPSIDNPEYKGEWKAKMIPNAAYKGPWVHPEIANPDYVDDPELYRVCADCGAVGFELWQVKAGSLFDDIIVTDSLAEAEAFAKETFEAKKAGEKAAYDALEATKKAEEEAARKAADDKSKADAADGDDDEDDDKDEL
jgi:calreticulin